MALSSSCRDLVLQKGQAPPEKKPKVPTADGEKGGKGKGPVESEGFMNALSSQAARMKEKKKKSKVVREGGFDY